jgi:hypothetical protein
MMIWVDGWQMQCCGEPFRLGSQVAWTLRAADPDWLAATLGSDAQQAVDAAEDHHGGVPDDTVPTRGRVRRIAAVHCRFAPEPGSDSPIQPGRLHLPSRGSAGVPNREPPVITGCPSCWQELAERMVSGHPFALGCHRYNGRAGPAGAGRACRRLGALSDRGGVSIGDRSADGGAVRARSTGVARGSQPAGRGSPGVGTVAISRRNSATCAWYSSWYRSHSPR